MIRPLCRTMGALLLALVTTGCEETAPRALDSGQQDRGASGQDLQPTGERPPADALLDDSGAGSGFPDDNASHFWIHLGETSALIYWQTGQIEAAATSHVEYGSSQTYGDQTPATTEPRWAQLHRITDLTAGQTYHFRMVMQLHDSQQISEDHTFTTLSLSDAIRIPGELAGPPYQLQQDNALYLLTQDISAGGTAIEVTGDDVTLELDGHSLTYGTSSGEQVFGIKVTSATRAVIGNGHIIQGDAAGDYSSGVESRWREAPLEVFGITTEVHRPNGYPARLFGSGRDAEFHHNHFQSAVTELESRHYPGNDLLRITASGPNVRVHHNLLTEGCHRAITVSGDGQGVEVAYNDIRHHALYVNGYALGCGVDAMDVHHNRVTSTGRGVHLTGDGIQLHHNHLDIKGHMTLSDLPAGSRPFKERMIELHGIKFEGTGVRNAKVYDNTMRIIQLLPDADWEYVPATPLNIACYDPDASNEVYDNTFIALTQYQETRHGGYGDSGQWASAIYLVGMDHGEASAGQHSIHVHDNTFISNDLFVSASTVVNMTVRIENNTFVLADDPPPTSSHTPFRNIGQPLEEAITSGGNTFQGMAP